MIPLVNLRWGSSRISKALRRPIQHHYMLHAAHPQATLLIREPFMPGVLRYAVLLGEQLDLSTHHAAEAVAATEP